jgi:hypothetical protein
MSKLVRVSVFAGAVLLLLAVMALLGLRSGDRSALQKYEAELRAKGERLTFAELTRGRQTNAVDSYALLTNATAKLSGARLYPGALEVRKYAGSGQARVTWRQASPTWMSSASHSGGGTWEDLTAQMQAAQPTLQAIREALREPMADAGPYTNKLESPRVNYVANRIAAHWLMGAAETELHQGRREEALQDLEALAGLARMDRNEYTLVAQMIRVAVASVGLSVTWEALQAPDWTEPQLARLQHAWEPVDLVEAGEKGFLGGRAFGHELFAVVRRSSGSRAGNLVRLRSNVGPSSSKRTFEGAAMDYLLLPAYKLTSIDADELFYLEIVQENIAVIRLVKAHRPWPEARQAALKAAARLSLATAPDRFRHYISLMGIPNFTRVHERTIQAEVERQTTLAAIALKRYQLQQGQLPPSLDTLVPELLSTVPYDCMSAKPLGYRPKADGNYVLYSVGEDGKDDGGDPTPPPGAAPGLWGNRDAVWPSPAPEPSEPPRSPDR